MGLKLQQIYAAIGKAGGMQSQMRLAMMTGVPSQLAGRIADSAELLARFTHVYKEITGSACPVR